MKRDMCASHIVSYFPPPGEEARNTTGQIQVLPAGLSGYVYPKLRIRDSEWAGDLAHIGLDMNTEDVSSISKWVEYCM